METKICCKCNVELNIQNQYKETHYTGIHYLNVCIKCIDEFASEYFIRHNQFPPCSDANCKWLFCRICPNNNECPCKNVEMAFKYPINACYSCGGMFEKELYREEHTGHHHVYGICLECIQIDLPYYIACRNKSVICSIGTEYGGKMYPCDMSINIGLSEEILEESNKISESWDRKIEGQKQLLQTIKSFKAFIVNKGPWEGIDQFKECMVNPKLRPCPKCGLFITHTDGCWRMNCLICHHSFWFPTGEDWNSFSSEKQTQYGGKDMEWWLDAGKLEYYWLDWFPNDLREELLKQLS